MSRTYPSSLGTSDADHIRLLGHDLAGELMGNVGFGELAFWLLAARRPTKGEARVFEAVLVALADHGFTPTAIAARITYLSAPGLEGKFGRRLQFADDIRYTLTEPEFEVESYLRHQASSFVKRFDANTYLCMSRALTYFDLARQYGGGSLPKALRNVSARTLLIAFSSDWLYPPAGSADVEEALRSLGKPAEFHVIEAPYGHDCFLLEEARQIPIIRRFLAEGRIGG